MRIAFVSYEFPPETGGGGIGTYLLHASRMLARLGHEVEIFCGTSGNPRTEAIEGCTVHRLTSPDSPSFKDCVAPVFAGRHAARAFHVIEGCDFDASALRVKERFPTLPYVAKLHTPRFVIDELQHRAPSARQRVRIALGALRRGRLFLSPPIRRQAAAQDEIAALRLADAIAAPSRAIADAAVTWAPLSRAKISVFPYPYEPPAALLDIPVRTETKRVTFIGRLEERKGVVELAAAIPAVLGRFPDACFRFVGRDMDASDGGPSMRRHLERRLGRHGAAVEFTGAVAAREIPRYLAETDIVAAPSHWESFGLVCCEALAAARGVIGSASGGMGEILDGGRCGLLVPPRHPDELAAAIISLLGDPAHRTALGEAGRRRILEYYSADHVMKAQIATYERAIAVCHGPA